jgi:hypothetical protein
MDALSWPAGPADNTFIETVCKMFADLGISVRGHDPRYWNTPLENVDLYLIHWPDALFWQEPSEARLWFWIMRVIVNISLLKARGTRIIWFVHNLCPHDLPVKRKRVWDLYIAALSRLIDGWITLSPSTDTLVVEIYPKLAEKRHVFIWHPPYNDEYGKSAEQARREIGLSVDALVFGHAGLLRPYKNLVALAQLFVDLAPDGAVLYLTGRPESSVDVNLSALCVEKNSISYQASSLNRPEFDRALLAMDVFVAPYRRFLHSGAIIHALCRGCVVVAPLTPFTADLAHALGDNYLILYEKELNDAVLSRAAQAVRDNCGQTPDLSMLLSVCNFERLHGLLLDIGLQVPEKWWNVSDETI